jgi:hypothetical protein
MHLNDPPAPREPDAVARPDPASTPAPDHNPYAAPRAALSEGPRELRFGRWRAFALVCNGGALLFGVPGLVMMGSWMAGSASGRFGLGLLLFGSLPVLAQAYNVASLLLWRRVPALYRVAQVLNAVLAVLSLVMALVTLAQLLRDAGVGGFGLRVLLLGVAGMLPYVSACIAAMAEDGLLEEARGSAAPA